MICFVFFLVLDVFDVVVFCVYMSIIEVSLSCYYILVFDDVKINIGFVFNRILGMFIVLIDGIFVFIWIIFLDIFSYIIL